ncbi:MAG: NUDIX domain-containing protein [Solitalea-like symbiont of Acarus siro]
MQAAGGIVMNQLSEYLLIYRRDLWDLPKGKVEDKENLQQAAIREVQEETGIKASNVLNFVTNTWHCYLCDDKITLK